MVSKLKPTPETPVSSRFAVLKDLTKSGQGSPDEVLHQLSQLLAPSKIRGTLQLQILEGERTKTASYFTVTFGRAKVGNAGKAPAKRNVELITSPGTFAEIASGQLAPHDAYLSGRLRVRGDVALAQMMLKHAAGSDGVTTLCGVEGE